MSDTRLRIAVIAHGLRAAGGISVATNIIRSLITVRPEYTYLIVAPDSEDYRSLEASPLVTVEYFQHHSYLQRITFDEITLRRRLRSFKPDLIFSLGNMPVRGSDAFQALLFHNAYLAYPDICIPRQPLIVRLAILAQRSLVMRRLRLVSIVFCQTEVMRRRFKEAFGYHGEVLILPNAISRDVILHTRETISKRLMVPENTFRLLVLTRYYAHKNLEILVDCFDRFRRELHDVVAILTIAEAQHPNAKDLLAEIRRRHLDTQIINIGPAPQHLLPDYYRQVNALLLPTLLESFSGTYLEAMSFGTPILTSDRDFARETCGDAAIYFDPLSPEAIRDSILTLKNSDELRKKLIQAGDRQLGSFSGNWDTIVANAIGEIEARLDSPRIR